VLVVGAGPSGLVAAYHAASLGAGVEVVERNSEPGEKLLLTGGGRCNILPAAFDEGAFATSSSRNSLRKILRGWEPSAACEFVEGTCGVAISAEEGTGKLFPSSGRATDVRDALVAISAGAGAVLTCGCRTDCLRQIPDGRWEYRCESRTSRVADRVILATGGCSWPKTGSDGLGLELARSLGHRIVRPSPALVPLAFSDARWAELAGVTVEATIRDPNGALLSRGNLLVTHQGFSGPAVLDASHRWEDGLRIQWCAVDAPVWDAELRAGRGRVLSLIRRRIPERLSSFLMGEAGLSATLGFSDLRREGRRRLVEALTGYCLPVSGTGGWSKAEVTSGGVALGDVDPGTLESRITPGLFFAGEMLDAFGPVGGYNLYWAFLTGRLAGLGAAVG